MHFTDCEIIAAIKTGNDTKALEFLYKKALPKIKSYVRSNGGSSDDAYDIFQDGIVAFYKYVISGRFIDGSDIQGFLYSTCRNLWINKAKHDSRTFRISEAHDLTCDTTILNEIISRERETQVLELLSKLGERCEELLTFAFYQKLSSKEICEKMGFATEDAVKTKKYKCKQRLLEILNLNPTKEKIEL